jgi:pyruvate/2-oxoglutarate/acetoin dehydrogenase E1 component
MRIIKTTQAINEALVQSMHQNPLLVSYGLGHNDPKRIFGTTENLVEFYGENRAYDVPTSENALTGIGVGLGIAGVGSVITHQRLDFFLLAMDQLVNSAAKWYFMFGNKSSVPVTIRLIVGKGWGQGPTHSQMLHAWFAHIPGLKVVSPSSPYTAKGLLISAIEDPNPVIFIEHRWIHDVIEDVPDEIYHLPLNKSRVLKQGEELTIVTSSYQTNQVRALYSFFDSAKVSIEHIDLISYAPLDLDTIYKSVNKTKRLVIIDDGYPVLSVASEIAFRVVEKLFSKIVKPPLCILRDNIPEPTSFNLTKSQYISNERIISEILTYLDRNQDYTNFHSKDLNSLHDIPHSDFKGPF